MLVACWSYTLRVYCAHVQDLAWKYLIIKCVLGCEDNRDLLAVVL